jgi:hypothetical protein
VNTHTVPSLTQKESTAKHHDVPIGAMPVPLKDGKRKLGDWEFHYEGWELSNDRYHKYVTEENMFPEEQKGCLDAEKLCALGLNKK